jgi:hypothetical protein
MMIQAKFGLIWPSGFRGEDFTDGRQMITAILITYIKGGTPAQIYLEKGSAMTGWNPIDFQSQRSRSLGPIFTA